MKLITMKQQVMMLPYIGKSRFSQFKQLCPFSREKFRQFSKLGKDPQPERLGVRCTFYDNSELDKFLATPLSYEASKRGEIEGVK